MSDSEDSTVTYTVVSSPFGGLSNIGSPGVDGPPVMPKDPYSYVVAAFQARYLLIMCRVLSYVPESDLEEDSEEDDDEDSMEDPANYLADGGDNGDDEDESSDDDEDDDVDIERDEEEEEHPAPVDFTVVALPAVDQAPSAEETESFKTDESGATPPPHPAYQVTARISIRDEPPTPLWSDTEVARLLAIPTPPPSPLSPWSSPLPQIPSSPLPPILSPLPLSPPLPISSPSLSSSLIYPLGYRATMIQLRSEAPSTSHSPPPHIILSHTRSDAPPSGTPPLLPILLPTSSPPLHLLSTHRRADKPEVTLPPRKRLGITLGLRYEVGERSSAPTARPPGGFRVDYGFVAIMDREIMQDLERDVGYGITDTWDEMLVDMSGASAMDDRKMAPKKATRLNTTSETTNTTSVTNAQLQAMVDQGVTATLAARDANRSTNDDDSHNSGMGVRRTERAARECTYTDFLKCEPLNFKGTEGVAGLSQWFKRIGSVFYISNCTVEN
ncbi:hypothetical protein Tco_1276597 [Tanacetum coccineum]